MRSYMAHFGFHIFLLFFRRALAPLICSVASVQHEQILPDAHKRTRGEGFVRHGKRVFLYHATTMTGLGWDELESNVAPCGRGKRRSLGHEAMGDEDVDMYVTVPLHDWQRWC